MKRHKRVMLWMLAKVMASLSQERLEKMPREHPRVFGLLAKLSSYLNEQPTRYELSGKQLFRAVDLRNLAVRHLNALAEEGAPADRVQRMQRLYLLAEEEVNAAIEADRLNMELEVSDIEDAASEERGP